MITGYVSSNLDPLISLTVYGALGEMREVTAVVDTGYFGYLTLSTDVIAALGLVPAGDQQLTLADGSVIDSTLCPATIIWDGQPRTIEVDAIDSESLAGMSLLKGHELNMQVIAGGPVTINPLQQPSP
ncbi:MAG: clan AA aspartic protease [Blastocatellia bacterium]